MTTVKRLSKPALFRRLGYTPHPGQLLVHNSTAPRRVLACGSRWGKSTCAAYEAVAALLQPCKESLGWIVAPTLEASDRVFRRVHWTFVQHMKHRIVVSNERERMLRVCNLAGGISEVRGKTAENPIGLLGEGLDFVIIDEAARLPAHVWQEALAQRLVDRQGWALMLSTPHGANNWFFRAFKLGQRNRDAAYQSWQSPSWTNPHLPAEAIEAERLRLPKYAFEQEFGAVFVGADLDPCGKCLGPLATASGVVILRGDEPLPLCTECNKPINALSGLSVVKRGPGGVGSVNLIHLFPVLGADPGFPESVERILREKDVVEQREPFDYEDEGEEDGEEEEAEVEADVDDGVEFERQVAHELGIGAEHMVIYLPEAEDMEDWEE